MKANYVESDFYDKLVRLFNKYDCYDIRIIKWRFNYDPKPSILDFSREQSDRNFENGYETTVKALSKRLR